MKFFMIKIFTYFNGMKLKCIHVITAVLVIYTLVSCREFLRPIKVEGRLTDYYSGEPIKGFQFISENMGASGLFTNPKSVYSEGLYTDSEGKFSAKFEEERGEYYYLSYEVYHNLTYYVVNFDYNRDLERGCNKFNIKAKKEQNQFIELVNTTQVYKYFRFDIEVNTEAWYSRLPASGRYRLSRVFPEQDNLINIDLFKDSIEYYPDTTIELKINRPLNDVRDIIVEI